MYSRKIVRFVIGLRLRCFLRIPESAESRLKLQNDLVLGDRQHNAQFALLVPVLTKRSCFSLSASDFSFRSSSFSVSAVSCSYGVCVTTPFTSSGRDVRSGNVCRAESVAPESVRLSFESISVAGGVTFTAQK